MVGEPPQLVVDDLHQPFQRFGIAVAPGYQALRYEACRGGLHEQFRVPSNIDNPSDTRGAASLDSVTPSTIRKLSPDGSFDLVLTRYGPESVNETLGRQA